MSTKDYHIYSIGLLLCVVLLLALGGCAYQAKLLDHRQVEPDSGVIVRCKVVKEPIIKVSESGDFIFWWAGGPGPVTYSVAKVVNERNNDMYRKRLKPVLEVDYFCEAFEANLKKAIEENGLRVNGISIEHEEAGIPVWSNVQDLNIFGTSAKKRAHKYVLQLKVSCGLFKSEAKSVAQLEGQLSRRAGNKVLWKNKLSFEGQAGGEHKQYGHGNEAVKQWEKDDTVLRDCLMEVVDGVTKMLAQELADTTEQQHRELTKLKLKDGSKIKGSIIDESQERLVVRLEGGSVRSMLAENVVSMNQ
ncbi:MAG TPA: hypothetical protein HPP66_00105 [Planctomycetes bacterium]|nr:hypothetical protein [Planctomycetota bacterium]